MWLLEQCSDNVEEIAEDYVRYLVDNYRKGIREIVEGAPYRPPYDVVKRAMQESLDAVGLKVNPETLEEGAKLFRWLHVETSTSYPGIDRFLELLRNTGLLLGVITNSFEKHLQLILSKLNMLHFFKCLVDGGDVKAFKPMKEPFIRVLDCLGTKSDETLFIGDEYYADIVGSTSVGMDAIWVNSRSVKLEDMIDKYGENSRPLHIVQAVIELEEYL